MERYFGRVTIANAKKEIKKFKGFYRRAKKLKQKSFDFSKIMNTTLFIFCGIPFSGKTTLAKKLSEKFGFVRVDLDEIKFDLFGKNILDEQIDHAGWDKVFKKIYETIEIFLKAQKTIIYDTGNFTKHERDLVRKISDKLNIQTKTIFVNTSKKTAEKRWQENKLSKERFDVSENDFYEAMAEMEPPDFSENVIVYDEKDKAEDWLKVNFKN